MIPLRRGAWTSGSSPTRASRSAPVAVVTTGSVAHSVGDSIGVGNSAVQVWDIAKWPELRLTVGVRDHAA